MPTRSRRGGAKRRAPREGQLAIALRSDGTGRLAVISDTHGEPHPAAASVIATMRPDGILHAGDVGDPACLAPFSSIAPLALVRGNIDAHPSEWPDRMTIDLLAGDDLVMRFLLVHIALAGVQLRTDVGRLAAARGAQVVICGHSHVPFIGRDGGLAIFNPGSIGPRRHPLPIVFGVVEVAAGRVTMRHHAAATGATWTP